MASNIQRIYVNPDPNGEPFGQTGPGSYLDVNEALDAAEKLSREKRIDVTISDDRGRVFGFFCKHGGMRDSTMGVLSCCDEEDANDDFVEQDQTLD